MSRSIVLLACLLVPAAASGSGVGYAHATSQLKSDTKPALFMPLNLLDGDKTTVWCEGAEGDGVGEGVAIGFRGTVSIDEVRITTGDARDAASFKAHNRVKALELKTDEKRHTFVLVDNHEPQAFKLEKPLEVERLYLEIAGVTKGEGDDNATCLADVVFYSNGKPLNGSWLEGKLKHDSGRALLMGTWYAGPSGARDRFLDFYFDGTFHYSFRPFDPEEKKVELSGEYTYDGERLHLKVGDKPWVDLKTGPHPGKDDAVNVLEIESKALEHTLAGRWTDKR